LVILIDILNCNFFILFQFISFLFQLRCVVAF
jgi:hypothetical protein